MFFLYSLYFDFFFFCHVLSTLVKSFLSIFMLDSAMFSYFLSLSFFSFMSRTIFSSVCFSLLFFLSFIISLLINKHFLFTPPPLSISLYLSNYCRFLSLSLSRSLYVPQGVCIALCVCTTLNLNVRLGEQNLCPMRNKFSTMVVLLI